MMVAQADLTIKSRSSAAQVRLSCEECRHRKVKCDKLNPCSGCVRHGFACHLVESARPPQDLRKPPKQATASDTELADRVANLEQLLKRVSSGRYGSTSFEALSSAIPNSDTEPNSEIKMPNIGEWHDRNVQTAMTVNLPYHPRPPKTYLVSSFWEDIMEQVST